MTGSGWRKTKHWEENTSARGPRSLSGNKWDPGLQSACPMEDSHTQLTQILHGFSIAPQSDFFKAPPK